MYYLKKCIQFIKQDIQFIYYFGFKIAFYDFLKNFIFRKNVGIGKKIYYQKYENIKALLKEKYGKIIMSYNNQSFKEPEKIAENSPIWIFWWQGINDDTPDVVRKCIASIKKYKDKHSVNIITKENLNQYVEVPSLVLEKFNEGKMTITHFSDILRMELLYKYGGIWMDATILLKSELPQDMYNYSFYTIKHNLFSDFHVCKGLWTGYFLATSPQNVMIKCFRDLFREYWKYENVLICYLLIDCFIALGYENNQYFCNLIDQVPVNNTNVYFIDNDGNKCYDKKVFDSIVQDTTIFKLHFKKLFLEKLENDKLTNFGFLTSNYL